MLNKVIASFCIIDDLLRILQYHDDPQTEAPASEIITIAMIACLEFGGNMRKALTFVKEIDFFSFVPSESRFNRRIHNLMDILCALFPLFRAVWEKLEDCTDYVIDTFPVPVCENIRANRCKIASGKVFRGWIPSKREHFHGLKLHLIVSERGFITEFLITPGSWHDITGLNQMAIDLPPGSNLFGDRAYTDYIAEDLLQEVEGIQFCPIRKKNSKRFSHCRQYLAIMKRRIIETVGSCINALFPKHIHAITLKGFILKLICFVFAYNLNFLVKVAS